jgi:F-type H+-transporting ATPase subunit gamma
VPASLRELRSRRTSVSTTKKITRAMELIAASRIIKAQQRARAAAPFARELTRAVSAVATFSNVDHPLTTEKENPSRAAVLLITSDRGLAGAYSSSVIRAGEQLTGLLRDEGKEAVPYLSGRKAAAYYQFRRRTVAGQWAGRLLRRAVVQGGPGDRGRPDRGVPDPDRGGRGGRDPHRLHPVRLHADPDA